MDQLKGAFSFFVVCAIIVIAISAGGGGESLNGAGFYFLKIIMFPFIMLFKHPIITIGAVIGFFVFMEWWHRRP